jgi:hypothetical protein
VVDALLGEHRAGLLRDVAHGQETDEHHGHRREHRPPLAGVGDHRAEGVAERGGDQQDGEDLEKVRQRRGVFEGVRRVDVEEAAPIGSELLDGDLRRGRSHRDDLLGEGRLHGLGLTLVVEHRLAILVGLGLVIARGLDHGDLGIRRERLDHALGDQGQAPDDGQGEQDVDRRAREIHPEVADGLRRAPCESADERHQDGHAAGGGDEVLDGEREHLGEIAHGRLAAIPLPVGIGGKAHRGVERGVR